MNDEYRGPIAGFEEQAGEVGGPDAAASSLNEAGADQSRVVAEITNIFVGLGPEDFEHRMDLALEKVGLFARVDRLFVYLVSEDRSRVRNSNEWCAPGIQSLKSQLQNLSIQDFPWWLERVVKLEPIQVENVEDLPEEAQAEKAMLLAQGVRSFLVVPLASEGEPIGFLGFDSVSRLRSWSGSEIRFLSTVAELFVLFLARKAAEEARTKAMASMRQAEEIAGLGHFVRDWRTGEGYWSDGLCRIVGLEPGTCMTHEGFLGLIHPEDRPRVSQHIQSTIAQKMPIDVRFRLTRTNGEIIHIHAMAQNSCDVAGRPGYTRGVFLDISSAMQAELEKEQLRKQLLVSQKMEAVGRLAGGIAHDFNNMLTAILGFATLSEGLEMHEEVAENLDDIKSVALKAALLTQQLLAFSRKQMISPVNLNLNQVIRTSEMILQRVLGEDLELVVSLEEDLRPLLFDPSQMDQIIFNLVVNARDAMESGGRLSIKTSNTVWPGGEVGEPGEYVVLTVSDTGVGMDAQTQEMIFEPFFTTKDVSKGTGLGLSTVYGIVQQNKGFITLESSPGQGSSFHLYFPCLDAVKAPEAPPPPSPLLQVRPWVVLVVEDQDLVRRLVSRTLSRAGYQVMAAENGPDALDLVRSSGKTVDLLVTDVVMPHMSGSTLFSILQELQPGLRVLFMSGFSGDNISRHGVVEQDVNFISKPFTPDELELMVRRCLLED